MRRQLRFRRNTLATVLCYTLRQFVYDLISERESSNSPYVFKVNAYANQRTNTYT